ncbi:MULTISPECIES: c-type cytochrome [Arenibacter]|uniref:c-type cytochrome n=1 Tax=Arenibacter TaxID=178469 RepID=UPI0004DF3D88|nr:MULTISPECIES: c-type cytochrome [Arenibacter]GBF19385.1 cytochrome c-551 precursor [Arenibacter sp. NBRC 103722]
MRQIIIVGILLIACFYFLFSFSNRQVQENRPPEIRITAPLPNSTFNWNSILPYEIQVSDFEDGNSEYDEINPNEVLLIVQYLRDSSELKPYLKRKSNTNYETLIQMGCSTCFNCHRAKGKLIGPSFTDISAKYERDPKTIELLAKKIMTGSSSVWGDEKMPPHPDLMAGQVRELVRWILENNSDSNRDYLAGLRGSIKTRENVEDKEKGILVMTAIYKDHGSDNQGQSSIQAQNTLILKNH